MFYECILISTLNPFTAYIEVARKVENPTQAVQLLSSARLMLKGNLTKIKVENIFQLEKLHLVCCESVTLKS